MAKVWAKRVQYVDLTGSTTQSTLKYEDVVSSLLSEEMRRKSMDGHSTDALFVRGHTQDMNPGKSSGGDLNLQVDLSLQENLYGNAESVVK